jgi:hypothetical protein
MWCPQCKAEYVQGITRCPECDVDLVDKLPEEEPEIIIREKIEWVEVLNTFNQGDVAVIKSILDNAEITYYLIGEHVGITRPWVDPVRVMVKKEEVFEAKELLADFI